MEEEIGVQTDLFSLMPGVKGGRAVVQQRGQSHMQAIGRLGGTAIRNRHGVSYLRELGRIGRQIQRDRRNRMIRVIEFLPGISYKIIPYFPAGRRRKHPIWVRSFLGEDEEERQ